MNNNEITTAIHRDLDKIINTTFPRLLDEYTKERKKLSVNKTKDYPRNYAIKTATKNPWIIFIQKRPEVSKFKTSYDAFGCAVVYYYSKQGLKVFRYESAGKFMEVFYGHFFTRYNQRMNLNLNCQVDIIRTFFTHNVQINSLKKPGENKTYVYGTCNHGATLGEYYEDINWLVHKTFITHAQKRKDQRLKETQIDALLLTEFIKKTLLEDFGQTPEEVLEEILATQPELLAIEQRVA